MEQKTPFLTFDASFQDITGPSPRLELLSENTDYPFAHEAGIFIPSTNELFITSNRHLDNNGTIQIKISKVKISPEASSCSCSCSELETENVPMANGGIHYKDGILFCAQGTLDQPGGIAFMQSKPPHKSHLLVQSYHGKPFNSPNDVVVHSSGSIWFTDPIYGYEQGIRPPPELPNQVYCYEPETDDVRVVADGFGRPNGICFSPDERVVYITDTDRIHGDGSVDPDREASM
ncbi:gluconolactonase precursor [Venturia nashicola]|uniref:Gluconolactonase n=1 Tax=Venturia nashicola TaxID=86259 RepID=A0A4Z1NZJ0_9PEZI|nr:gluconolactonase precursor [Venturia nashicola]